MAFTANEEEVDVYSSIFMRISGNMSTIPCEDFEYAFLSTGLRDSQLKNIRKICGLERGSNVGREVFYTLCRLISHCQSGYHLDECLLNIKPTRIPVFANIPMQYTDQVGVSSYDDMPMPSFYDNVSHTKRGQFYNGALNWVEASDKEILEKLNYVVDENKAVPENFPTSQTVSSVYQSNKDGNSYESTRIDDTKISGWEITSSKRDLYKKEFVKLNADANGFLSGKTVKEFFGASPLSKKLLALIWRMVDPQNRGKLNLDQFSTAQHLAHKCCTGYSLPADLPNELESLVYPEKMERETAKQIHGTFKGLENLEREISNYGYSSSVDQQMGNEFLHSRHPLSDSNAPIDNTEFSQLRNADNILEDSIDSDRVLCEEINAEIDETLADVNRTVSDVKELSMDISRLKVEVQIKREHVDNLKSEALLANQKLTKLEASRKTLSNKDVSDMRNVKQLQVQGAYLESILGRDRSNLTTVSNECVVLEAELQELRTKVIKWNNDRTAVTNEISIELRKLNEEEREVTLLTTEIDKITRSDFKMSESYLENIRSQNVISSMNQPFPTEEYSAPNTSWKELIKSGRNYS